MAYLKQQSSFFIMQYLCHESVLSNNLVLVAQQQKQPQTQLYSYASFSLSISTCQFQQTQQQLYIAKNQTQPSIIKFNNESMLSYNIGFDMIGFWTKNKKFDLKFETDTQNLKVAPSISSKLEWISISFVRAWAS